MTVDENFNDVARVRTIALNGAEIGSLCIRARAIYAEVARRQSANVHAYDRQMERDRSGIGAIDAGRADNAAAARVMDALAKEDARILKNDMAVAALHKKCIGLLERILVLDDEVIEAYRELVEYGPLDIDKCRKDLEKYESKLAKAISDVPEMKARLKKAKESGDAEKIAMARRWLKYAKRRVPSVRRCIKPCRRSLDSAEKTLEDNRLALEREISTREETAAMLERAKKNLENTENDIADDEARIRRSQEMAARLRGNGV